MLTLCKKCLSFREQRFTPNVTKKTAAPECQHRSKFLLPEIEHLICEKKKKLAADTIVTFCQKILYILGTTFYPRRDIQLQFTNQKLHKHYF